jgi:hypothetical protein
MITRTPRLLAFTTLLVLGTAGRAHAQSSENKAAAAAAFEKAKELMDGGDTAGACEQFERSQELDAEFGTQYNLALCYQQLGKLASAYGEFDELAGKDTNAKRKAKAKAYAAQLKPRLTSLTLIVNDPAPQLVVARDDQDITLLVGVTTPVDPGVYTFEASAPGRKTWSQKVDLTAEGATITVEIPLLAEEVADPGDGDDGGDDDDDDGGQGAGAHRPAVAKKAHHGGGKGRTLIGLVTAGTGAVATGVGLFFGFQASGHTSDAKDACGGALDPCTGDVVAAQADIKSARSAAMLSNIFVGVGLVAVAAGVVVWLTAPGDDDRDEHHATLVPVVNAEGGGLVLDGAF